MPPDNVGKPRQIKLPRRRLRAIAAKLYSLHRTPPSPPIPTHSITVVCISDTHCTQPPLPPGDLLLHAGDLTQWGTFTEIQAQLTWLFQQPHKHKVVIAGNHDLLLDPDFKHSHPERWKQAMNAACADHTGKGKEEDVKTAEDLDWGDIHYLHNSSVRLPFPVGDRTLSIYGSPVTPKHGLSAFQHPIGDDLWTGTVPPDTDIVLTHGPPRGHLDGVKKSGCSFLAREVVRVRLRLVVFGHIHVGYGIEERIYDGVGRAHEGIEGGWGGWEDLWGMLGAVIRGWIMPRRWRREEGKTTFVNAAVVEGWEEYKVKNEAAIVKI